MAKLTSIQKRIFEAMKVTDENRKRLSTRLLETGAAPACARCGGSGNYAYNMVHGTICYGCSGFGVKYESEEKLLEIVESEEIQTRLTKYLEELEAKKVIKVKPAVTEPKPTTKGDMVQEMLQDAIENLDWEFAVRIIVVQKLKNNQLVQSNKQATDKQVYYIKSLVKRKAAKQQSDKDNLTKLIEEVENKTNSLNQQEVQYIINWLSEK